MSSEDKKQKMNIVMEDVIQTARILWVINPDEIHPHFKTVVEFKNFIVNCVQRYLSPSEEFVETFGFSAYVTATENSLLVHVRIAPDKLEKNLMRLGVLSQSDLDALDLKEHIDEMV